LSKKHTDLILILRSPVIQIDVFFTFFPISKLKMLAKYLILAILVVQLNGQEEDPLYGNIFNPNYGNPTTAPPIVVTPQVTPSPAPLIVVTPRVTPNPAPSEGPNEV
jgi:hypothetical protein